MGVYVDDRSIRIGNARVSYFIADTPEEFDKMLEYAEIPRHRVHSAGTYRERADVTQKMKKRLIEWGAKEITQRELVEKLENRIGKYGEIVPR